MNVFSLIFLSIVIAAFFPCATAFSCEECAPRRGCSFKAVGNVKYDEETEDWIVIGDEFPFFFILSPFNSFLSLSVPCGCEYKCPNLTTTEKMIPTCPVCDDGGPNCVLDHQDDDCSCHHACCEVSCPGKLIEDCQCFPPLCDCRCQEETFVETLCDIEKARQDCLGTEHAICQFEVLNESECNFGCSCIDDNPITAPPLCDIEEARQGCLGTEHAICQFEVFNETECSFGCACVDDDPPFITCEDYLVGEREFCLNSNSNILQCSYLVPDPAMCQGFCECNPVTQRSKRLRCMPIKN